MKPEELLIIIDHNLTKPKPHHMNKDLMTCALEMERHDRKKPNQRTMRNDTQKAMQKDDTELSLSV